MLLQVCPGWSFLEKWTFKLDRHQKARGKVILSVTHDPPDCQREVALPAGPSEMIAIDCDKLIFQTQSALE